MTPRRSTAALALPAAVLWRLLAAAPAALAQEAPPDPPPGPSFPDIPSADDIGAAVAGALVGPMPAAIARGITQFLGELGHWLYETMGAFFRGADIVTRFPEPWTTGHPVVQGLYEGMRVLALALLGLTFVGALWQARRGGGEGAHPAALPVAVMQRVVLGGVAILVSMELARQVLRLVDAVYAWVANAPLGELIPGWGGAAQADLETAEGVGLLLYGVECVLLFLHALGGVFYFDAMLVLMPLAIWCETTGVADLRHWFAVWAKAVGGAIGAKLALGVSLRLAVAFVQSGLLSSSWPDVPAAVLALMMGGAGLLVTLKLASMGHQGIEMFHPFATAGRVAQGARTATTTAWGVVAVPFVGPAAAATAAGTAPGAPAPTPGAPVPSSPAPSPTS